MSDPKAAGRPFPAFQLVRNSAWSFIGAAVPMLIAVLIFPFLLARLGTDRFGLLALIWGAIGYFNLFDLGVGRALTHQVAARIAQGRADSVPQLVRAGVVTLLVLGVLAGIGMAWSARWAIETALNLPAVYHEEAQGSMLLLAASLPLVLLSAGLVGVLEGLQQFRVLAFIRIPLGSSSFALPGLIALFTPSLDAITMGLVASRALAVWVLARTLRESLGRSGWQVSAFWGDVRQLLRIGGWMTVSNVVGPILVYVDRFFIGSIVGASAVGYYATPHEIVSRLSIVPHSIVSALFPAITGEAARTGGALAALTRDMNRIMVLVMLPMTLGVALFARELLAVWLGAEFADQSAEVAVVLAAGTLANAFARIPFVALQGAGRADVTAKLHMLELAPYLAFLVWAVDTHGVVGAAFAWLLRVCVDTWLLCWATARITPALRDFAWKNAILSGAACIALLGASQIDSGVLRALMLLGVTGGAMHALWAGLRMRATRSSGE